MYNNESFKKKTVIKPAAQQGFWRPVHFLHIRLSVQVMMHEYSPFPD